MSDVTKGSMVKFVGYGEDVPEDEQILEVGAEYEVQSVNSKEKMVTVLADNPDNPDEKILVDVFENEYEPVAGGKGRRAAKETAAPAAKGKAAAKEGAGEKAEKAKPAAAKGKAAAPSKGKAAPASKGKAKEPQEDSEDTDDEFGDLTEDMEDQELLSLVNEAENVLDLAREMAFESSIGEYRLGGVLFHVRKSKAYTSLDPRYAENGGFGLYTSEVLGVEYRKAMHLIKIYYTTSKYQLDVNRVAEIGWSKASRIAAVMTDENAEELLEAAESQSVKDLEETIRTAYREVGGTKGEKKQVTKLNFKLFEDQGPFVVNTLNTLAHRMGFKRLEEALEHIVREWAIEHLGVEAPAQEAEHGQEGEPSHGRRGAAKPAATKPSASRGAARPTARR